jgi:hypothetical protein
MTATLLPNAKQQFIDSNGKPLAGGSVYFYIPNTTTFKNTWQDAGQTILNTNPVVLDASGQAVIWGNGVYRQVVYDQFGNLIWDKITEDTSGGLIGNMVDNLFHAPADFTPGTTTQLPLTVSPGTVSNTWIYFDGVYQTDDAISLSGTTLTFSSPIPVGVSEVTVKIGSTLPVGTPANSSVTDATVAFNAGIQSNKLAFLFPSAGSVSRTVQSKLADIVSVLDFGATVGGDLYAPLNSAIAYLTSVNGGTVIIPPSAQQWTLSNTVVINNSDIQILGAGHGDSHDSGTGNNAATVIQWTGAVNGDMFQIQPTATAARALRGNGFRGIFLIANGAGRGVSLRSSCDGVYDFSGSEFTIAMMDMNVLTTLTEAADTQRNEISLRGRQVAGGGGSILLCGGSATANVSFNQFKLIKALYANITAAIWMLSSDNNLFETVQMVRGTGTGIGVLLDSTTASTVPAASNMFINLSPGAGGVYAAGTERGTFPSVYNSVLFYDKGNGPPDPIIGPNSVFYWSSNYQGSIGNRKDTLSAGANWYVDSNGRFHVYGLVTIAGNSTTGVSLPAGITVSTGISSIQMTPHGSSVSPFSATWTGTQVNFNNGSATATDFWYEVVGF